MRRLRTAAPGARSSRRSEGSLTPSSPSSPVNTSHGSSTPPPAASNTRRIELIVKLGGSALTDKTTAHAVHPARFTAAMDTIARLHQLRLGFVVVHGAGSFGHFEAAAHGVSTGSATPLGVAETHAAVTQLNGLVVDELVSRGVPAVGVSPLLVPAKVRVDFVAALLDRGHLPVLHGDACYAGDGRTAVLSGDALVASLAAAFEFVTRAVFLSDVPGVLAAPPEELGAGGVVGVSEEAVERALVRCVTVNGAGVVALQAEVRTSSKGHDVTGGITGKVAAAARCVAESRGRVVAFIAGVGTKGAECALRGRLPEPWCSLPCTRITYDAAPGERGVDSVGADSSSGSSSAGSRRRSWFSL